MPLNITRLVRLLAAAALLGACRQETPTPQSSPTPPNTADLQVFPPEASATGRTGPIELTLKLYKKKIRAQAKNETEDNADCPWVLLELKNVGKKKYLITEERFYTPEPLTKRFDPRSSGLIYIELLDSRGKPVERYWPIEGHPDPLALERSSPELRSLLERQRQAGDEARKEGLEYWQVAQRMSEVDADKRSQAYWEARDEIWSRRRADPRSWLEPGQSARALPWMQHYRQEAGVRPVGPYTELSYFDLKPGRYRLRAVYNHKISDDASPLVKKAQDETDVLVKTPFLEFEVSP